MGRRNFKCLLPLSAPRSKFLESAEKKMHQPMCKCKRGRGILQPPLFRPARGRGGKRGEEEGGGGRRWEEEGKSLPVTAETSAVEAKKRLQATMEEEEGGRGEEEGREEDGGGRRRGK